MFNIAVGFITEWWPALIAGVGVIWGFVQKQLAYRRGKKDAIKEQEIENAKEYQRARKSADKAASNNGDPIERLRNHGALRD